MNKNRTLHAIFSLINYTLTITTTTGGTTSPAPGAYVHASGSDVSVTAIPNANYTFNHWELDGVNVGSANPYPVLMTQNHTLKAFFASAPLPPQLTVSISPPSATILVGQSVTFTSTVSGGTTPYGYQWYLGGNSVAGANSTSWIFTPAAIGVYYVYLNVTDANGTTAQSNTARIVVTAVTVGGYSISLTKQTQTQTIAAYIMLIALFGAVISLTKRKRK
jgi:hypothetical protein